MDFQAMTGKQLETITELTHQNRDYFRAYQTLQNQMAQKFEYQQELIRIQQIEIESLKQQLMRAGVHKDGHNLEEEMIQSNHEFQSQLKELKEQLSHKDDEVKKRDDRILALEEEKYQKLIIVDQYQKNQELQMEDKRYQIEKMEKKNLIQDTLEDGQEKLMMNIDDHPDQIESTKKEIEKGIELRRSQMKDVHTQYENPIYIRIINFDQTLVVHVNLNQAGIHQIKQMYSLRGGGCCPQVAMTIDLNFQQGGQQVLPRNFKSKISEHVKIIKSNKMSEEQQLNSLQYLVLREQYFRCLVDDQGEANRYVDLLCEAIKDLLSSAERFVKSNGHLCFLTLQVSAWIAKAIFWFYSNTVDRKISVDEQKEILNNLQAIQQQIDIESTIHESAIQYEIYVIKMIYTIIPNDEEQGQEILAKFATGALTSIWKMKITDDLIYALKQGGQYILNEGMKEYCRNQYQAIFYIESVYWQIVDKLEQGFISDILSIVSEAYQKIKDSSWEIQYCWIKTIGSIISIRPKLDIELEEHTFRSLKTSKSLIPIEEVHLVNINADKLKNSIEEQFFNQNKTLKKILTIQEKLLLGHKEIPKFINYAQINLDQSNIDETPKQYFMRLFNSVNISSLINKIKTINLSLTQIKNYNLQDNQIESYQTLLQNLENNIEQIQQLNPLFTQLSFIEELFQLDLEATLLQDQNKIIVQLNEFLIKYANKVCDINYSEMSTLLFQDKEIQSQNLIESIRLQLKQTRCLYLYVKKILSQQMLIKLFVEQICEQYEDDPQTFKANSSEFVFIQQELADLYAFPINTLQNLVTNVKKFERAEFDFNQTTLKPYQQQVYMIVQYENNNRFTIEIYSYFIKKLLLLESNRVEMLSFILKAFISIQQIIKINLQQQNQFRKQIQTLMSSIQYQQLSYNDLLYEMKREISQQLSIIDLPKIDKLQDIVKNRQKQITDDYETNKESLNEKLYKSYKKSFNEINELQKSFKIMKYLLEHKPQDYEEYLKDVSNNLSSKILKVEQKDLNEQIQVQQFQDQLTKQEYFQQFDVLNTLWSEERQQKIDKIQETIQVIYSIKSISNVKSSWLTSIQQDIKGLSISNIDIKPLYVPYTHSFIINTTLLNQITDKINPSKQTYKDQLMDYKDQLINDLFDDQTDLKTCVISQLFVIRERCLNMNSKISVDVSLLKIKALETNPKVKRILSSKEYMQDMNRILEQHWSSQQEEIITEIKSGIKDLNSLLYDLQQEDNPETKKLIQFRYSKKENQIQECLSNISSIGNSLGIQLLFIRDLKQDLQAIDQKLIEVQNTLRSMNKDISYLRGKTVYELLEIRKNNILQAKKLSDARSIYIKLKCIQRTFDKNQKHDSKTLFSGDDSDANSQLSEFLTQKQTSMLIHGPAGSGKSTASRKIEQYLWQQYDTQKQLKQILTIPILIQLPQLQDPEYSAITETLLSDNYMFNHNQIRDLKEEIKNQKIRLFIIMDSYDELRKEFIGTNLLITNKVSLWGSNIKVITTTRTEVLNIEHYEDWFLPENENSISLYKEVKLESFNDDQQRQYIEQYTILSVKNALYEAYTHFTDNQVILDNFLTLWKSLQIVYNMKSSENLLTLDQIQMIQSTILKDNNIKLENNEIKRQLQESLKELKSFKFFMDTIEKVNISHLLETPFMMEIVVQVLPSLIRQKSEQKIVQQMFTNQYNSQQIQEPLDKLWRVLVQSPFFEKYSIIKNKSEIKQLLQECNITKYQHIYADLLQFQVTQYDFYEVFFRMYFDKQLMKIKEQGQNLNYQQVLTEIWAFATQLAIDLTKRNKTTVEYKPSGLIEKKKVQSWEDYYFDDDCREGQYKKIFRSCIPIKVAANNYAFNHKSLQEFLVAKDLIDHLQQDLSQIFNFKDHFICLEDWSGDFLKGTCSFAVQNASNSKKIQENMKSIIKLTNNNLIELDSQQLIRLASNCMYLMAKIGTLFSGLDLRGIQIKNVNLSGANLSYCYLDGCKMDSVNISSIKVFNTSMKGVQFTNTKTNQYPSVQFEGQLLMNHGQLITVSHKAKVIKFPITGESFPLIDSAGWAVQDNSKILIHSRKELMIVDVIKKDKVIHQIKNTSMCKTFERKTFALVSELRANQKEEDNKFICVDNMTPYPIKTLRTIKNFWVLAENIFLIQSDDTISQVNNLMLIRYFNNQRLEERVLLDSLLEPKFISVQNQLIISGDQVQRWEIKEHFRLEIVQKIQRYHKVFECPNFDKLIAIDINNISLMSFDGIIIKSIPSTIPNHVFQMKQNILKHDFSEDTKLLIVYYEKECKIYGTDPLILYRTLPFKDLIETMWIQENKFLILQFPAYYEQLSLISLSRLNNQVQSDLIKFMPNSLNYVLQEESTNKILYYEYPNQKCRMLQQLPEACTYLEVSANSILWNYQIKKNVIWNPKENIFKELDDESEPKLVLQLHDINCQDKSPYRINLDKLHSRGVNQIYYYQSQTRGYCVYKDILFSFEEQQDYFNQLQVIQDKIVTITDQYVITEKQILSTTLQLLHSFTEAISCCALTDKYLIVAYAKEVKILNLVTWIILDTITDVQDTKCIFWQSDLFIGSTNKLIVYNLDKKTKQIIQKLPSQIQQIVGYHQEQVALLINKAVFVLNKDKQLTQLDGFRGNTIYFNNQVFASVDNDCIMYNTPTGQIQKLDFNFSSWQQMQIQMTNSEQQLSQGLVVYGIVNNQIVKYSIANKIQSTVFNINTEIPISKYDISKDLALFQVENSKILIYLYQGKYKVINFDFDLEYTRISDDYQSILVQGKQGQVKIYNIGSEFIFKDTLKILPGYNDIFVIFNEDSLIYIEEELLYQYTFKSKARKVLANLSSGYYTVGRTSKGFSIAHKDGSIDMYRKISYHDEVQNQAMENYVIFKTLNSSSAKGILYYETELKDAVIKTQEGVDLIGLFQKAISQ